MNHDKPAPVFASAERHILAPPELVWRVLTSLESWPNWHPGISNVALVGPMQAGSEFTWSVGGMRIRSTLVLVEPPLQLGWTGRAALGVRACHDWELQPSNTGTLVITKESMHGLVARLIPKTMTRMTQQSLNVFLEHLKNDCEKR